MRDPYQVLGVPKTATAAEIKAAFRKQAKQCHPDTHPGDAKKAAKFREISAAYDVVSDREKREQYDRGLINADGSPKMQQRAYSQAGQSAGGRPFEFDIGGFSCRNQLRVHFYCIGVRRCSRTLDTAIFRHFKLKMVNVVPECCDDCRRPDLVARV